MVDIRKQAKRLAQAELNPSPKPQFVLECGCGWEECAKCQPMLQSSANLVEDQRQSEIQSIPQPLEPENEHIQRARQDYSSFFCSITNELMVDPVTLTSGITYERMAIIDHFLKNGFVDPITNESVDQNILLPNKNLRLAIEKLRKDIPQLDEKPVAKPQPIIEVQEVTRDFDRSSRVTESKSEVKLPKLESTWLYNILGKNRDGFVFKHPSIVRKQSAINKVKIRLNMLGLTCSDVKLSLLKKTTLAFLQKCTVEELQEFQTRNLTYQI